MSDQENAEIDIALEQVFLSRILFAGETSEIELFSSPDVPSRDLIVLLGCGDDVIKDLTKVVLRLKVNWKREVLQKVINEYASQYQKHVADMGRTETPFTIFHKIINEQLSTSGEDASIKLTAAVDAVTTMTRVQRQSDLKAISFHFAIPVEDLQKALESKIDIDQ